MAWVLLLAAGVFEIAWALGLKYSDGFTRFWPSVWTLATMTASVVLLAAAVRTIPVGTGYAVWTGIGVLGTSILGIVLFAEPLTAWRVLFLVLILAGVVGLKWTAG
jgi:quaternary ammonium compound-resistance protein SugE